jgi:uncharacterized membrane protein YraQ (UPF0718 family)
MASTVINWVTLMIAVLSGSPRRLVLVALIILAAMIAAFLWPSKVLETLRFVIGSFVEVAPMIGVGLVLSAWVAASGAGTVTATWFQGSPTTTIIVASAIGVVTPVCGVTVLPLMTRFLASGVPLAPIMAFWLSSPITDPGMFAVTWAVLGPAFAIGKTVAAFALGLLGGFGTTALNATDMVRKPLRIHQKLDVAQSCVPVMAFNIRIWKEQQRRRVFWLEILSMTKLIVICLSLAFAAEYLLRDLVPQHVLAAYLGKDSLYAIPLATMVGAPMYLDGYAALPLIRGLLDLGMSPGAALAFLVSGGAVSIWGVLAIVPVLRASTIALFVVLAVIGSLILGYAFEGLWGLFL